MGDLLFAVPAMESLVAAYPDAELVLLGTPLAASLLSRRPGPVREVFTLPPAKGVYEPAGRGPDEDEQASFFRRVCERPVDLGVQLHGGGRWSNPFLLRLSPRWTVGSRTADAAPLTRWLPYAYYQNEMMRALEVAGLAGAPPVALEPRLTVTQADLDAAEPVLSGLPEPLLVVHPGATDPRRRWPTDRFAEVATKCAEEGASVVVIGSSAERDLIEEVVSTAHQRLPAAIRDAVRAVHEPGISTLCGVLARAAVLVGNDSGPRHLARAIGTPTVGLFWMGNVITAGPLGRARDRVLIAWTTSCPICGADTTREDLPRCEHNESFIGSIRREQTLHEVMDLLWADHSSQL